MRRDNMANILPGSILKGSKASIHKANILKASILKASMINMASIHRTGRVSGTRAVMDRHRLTRDRVIVGAWGMDGIGDIRKYLV